MSCILCLVNGQINIEKREAVTETKHCVSNEGKGEGGIIC